MADNLSKLSGRKGLEDNLFENLVGAIGPAGASPGALKQLADDYHLGEAIPFGTASFYDFLRRDHLDKKVVVCNGSSCLCAGTQDDLVGKLTGKLNRDEIGEICCLGRCHENRAFQYQGQNYSGDAIEQLDAILDGNASVHVDRYHVQSTMDPPMLTAPFSGVANYYSLLDEFLQQPSKIALEEVKTSGLRGRGGAGFPLGLKWDSCRVENSAEKYIVCNADEGDPGAYIDRYLLEEQPHSVLFGILVAGYCVGAESGVLYIRAEYPRAQEAVATAIREIEEAGYAGQSIQGSKLNFTFKVVNGAGAYICGEETSLLASIEGRRPEVSVRPPYPTVEGLYGKPTVVNNVESLACIHDILSIGGDAFARIGTEKSTGPKLASLDSAFNRPGIYEVPMGTPLQVLVEELGQGFSRPTKAIQVGGPLGGIVPCTKIGELTFDFESFQNAGFLLGHAGIIGIPEEMPMIEYMKHLLHFCAVESCGKCFPCRLGSVRGEEMLGHAINGTAKLDRGLLDDLLETLELGSLCGLGGGIPLPIRNVLEHFAEELSPHFAGN
ncbi:MAG: NADH-ubiquinone oxidoreductase-F iron-sulfur binding region domain-containing protein [Aeoliella sp.]